MSQRSITSFFMPKAKKPEVTEVKTPATPEKENGNLSDEPDGDSPVKQPRRGRPMIESDSEDEGPSAAASASGDTASSSADKPSPSASAAGASTAASTEVSAGSRSTSSTPHRSPPLRKTARKTPGGTKTRAEQQKKLIEQLKSSPSSIEESDAKGAHSPSKEDDPTQEDGGAGEDGSKNDNGELSSPRSDIKENLQPGQQDSSANADLKQPETDVKQQKKKAGSTGKSPSVKPSTKSKQPKSKPKASPAGAKGKPGKKRKSSDDPGQKKAKKERTISSDDEEEGKEDKSNQEDDAEMKEDKVEKEDGGMKKEKPADGGKLGAGIFGLQRTPSYSGSSSNDAGERNYDPSKKKYHPVNDAMWKPGEKVPFLALARTFDLIEGTSARLKMVHILANYFRSVTALSPDDLLPSVYLCLNKLAPAYEGVELGIGEQIITKAIAGATGRTSDKIKAEAAEKGDLALVAEASRSRQKVMFRPAPLSVQGVFKTLKLIARLSGHAVQQQKVGKMQCLLVACRESETRFIVRALSGKLRIGLAEQSALQALSQACAQTPPEQDRPVTVLDATSDLSTERARARLESAAITLKTTYCECPSYDEIVPVLLEHGLDALPKFCKIRPGVPLKPMLAHPTKGVSEVLTRFEGAAFTCEYKYDGERAQIHLLEDGSVRVYSRNQEDNTSKYPDILARFRSCLAENVKSCILDSEAVAWDTEKKTILPFQVLSTRKRKDANAEDIKVKVCVFAFDLLMLNGDSLVKEPFQTRREKLRDSFKEVDGEFTFAKSNDSTNVEDIAEFLDESIKGNCEGLMVKTLLKDATYEIAKRSRNWLKLKKDYLDGVGDTIDVVVIGGFLGKGKRAGGYGGFLLACYDPDNEEFQSVCKIGTGFSDEDLQTHSAYFSQHKIDSPKPYYQYTIEPDHWFDATQVWEIKCADLSISPVHKAAVGIVDPEKGISLRFPRFLRVREDKEPEAATSAQQIASMYRNQDQVKNQAAGAEKGDEEDFY